MVLTPTKNTSDISASINLFKYHLSPSLLAFTHECSPTSRLQIFFLVGILIAQVLKQNKLFGIYLRVYVFTFFFLFFSPSFKDFPQNSVLKGLFEGSWYYRKITYTGTSFLEYQQCFSLKLWLHCQRPHLKIIQCTLTSAVLVSPSNKNRS